MSESVRAIAYCRVSTREQGISGLGLEDQRRKVVAYAVACGYELNPKDIFEDPGNSGAKLDRPGLNALRQRALDPDVNVIIFPMMSRLTRRLKHLLSLVEEIHSTADVVFVSEGFDTRTPYGRAMMQVMGAMNELELELIRERTADALAVKKSNNERSAGRPPQGFLPLNDGGWMPVPADLVWVCEAFRLRYVLEYGWRAIAKDLRLRGCEAFSLDPANIAKKVRNDIYIHALDAETRAAVEHAGRTAPKLPNGSIMEFDPDREIVFKGEVVLAGEVAGDGV